MYVKHLVFDLDGTLTDPKVGITSCVQYALAKLGCSVPTTEELLWCIGPPLTENFQTLLPKADVALIQQAIALYRERFGTVGKYENEVYPAIPACLATLTARGYTLFVVTSKFHGFAEDILAHFHLASFFTRIYGSELGESGDKRILLQRFLQQEQIRPEDAIMIGDRKHDILAARQNGLRSMGVLYGYGSRAELLEAGADFLAETPAEIVEILQA
jgi:phosphoglycolate phosphatase